jgi:hypothetical protein
MNLVAAELNHSLPHPWHPMASMLRVAVPSAGQVDTWLSGQTGPADRSRRRFPFSAPDSGKPLSVDILELILPAVLVLALVLIWGTALARWLRTTERTR